MEPVLNESGKVRGMEILYFEEAELEKVKGNSTAFATFGSLSVLYFKDYNRYVLLLNDWKYPLLRRLPVLGQDKSDAENRTYSFPALNGFAFNLRIHKKGGSFALHNFDAILENNSRFTWKDADQAFRKVEESPDDHLTRHLKQEETTNVTEMIKQGFENFKHKIGAMKTGTNNLTSKTKGISQKDIKTKDFKKAASSKLGKNFFKSHEKQTSEFWQSRRGNLNNIVSRKFDDIKIFAGGPSLYLWRDELEETILNNKDIAVHGLSGFSLALHKEKPSDLERSWSQTSTQPSSVTQSMVGQGPMEYHSKNDSLRDSRTLKSTLPTDISLDRLNQNLTHYQG